LRPLLDSTSAELRSYLEGQGLPYREDATNRTPAYARNRVRLELLPALESHFGPGSLAGVLRSMALLQAEEEVVASLAERVKPEPRPGGGLGFRARQLAGLPLALGRRAVLAALAELVGGAEEELSLARVDGVLALATVGGSGKRVVFAGVEAVREKAELILRRAGEGPGCLDLELPVPGAVEVEELAVKVVATLRRRPPAAFSEDWLAADLAALELPLRLRHPEQGDRIAPLGLGGHTRSLARCLMDRGLGREARRAALVVADGRGPIWVAGQVASERIRVTGRCGPVVVVRLGPLARPGGRRGGSSRSSGV
jgi:tRNA(Ile)-lysidine synthase